VSVIFRFLEWYVCCTFEDKSVTDAWKNLLVVHLSVV